MLVDVYVNYDCDLKAPNLFERMVMSEHLQLMYVWMIYFSVFWLR